MNSLRRWLYRPKKSDSSLLAQFYFNDEELNAVAVEVDSIDGRKDPERCAELVNKLRTCQDRVLTTIQLIMAEAIPDRRTSRDFRVKFPDDVVQENLAGQLWFGAECLAAGSSIMNREEESTSMRPLARALTKNLDSLRCILREQCIRCLAEYSERIKEALVIFDKLFAEFELSYVSAMVPVKTRKEYEMIQEITVLFSETVQRALKQGHLTRDMIDEYDPALMFTIPRLAIVCGLLIYPEGPLNPDNPPTSMSDMFRPFQPLLFKIRELLSTLSSQELYSLEHALCTSEGQPLLTVLESQVSSSDNACQTDFDPSSPSRTCPPASLPSPSHVRSSQGAQGAECSSSSSSAALESCSSEGRRLAELPEELDPKSQADRPPVAACAGGAEEREAAVETVEERGEEEEGKEENGERAMLEEEKRKEELSGEVEEEELEAGELTSCKLNKSESNDSGLHSEYASHSENLTVSYSDSQQTLSLADSAAPSPLESPTYTMGSSEGAGCLEDTKAQTGTVSEEEEEERSGICPEEVPGSVSRDMVFSSRTDSGGSASDSGMGCSDCCMSAGDGAAEVEGTKLHATEGSSKRPDVLELQRSLKDDFEVDCECDGESPSHQQSPSRSCHQSPVSAGAGANTTTQHGPLGLQPCASSSQTSLPQGTETGEIDVVVLEEDCVFSDAVIDAATGNNACAKPKHEEPSAILSDSEESDVDGSENENTSSSDETNEGEGDGKEDGAHETKEDSSSEDEETDGQSAAVAELSLEGLSVGDLTTMENLIAGTVDLNGNRSARPPPPPSIQARVGGAGPPQGEGGECLRTPRVQRLRYAESCTSSCSGSAHSSPARDNQWEKESACSIASSETSSYNSECRDEEEIAMALQAAEVASRNQARMRFRSSSDMIHRLFMVISGVADQLQTNFASDLRHILRAVFDMNCSEPLVSSELKEAGILTPEIPHRRRPRSQMRPRPRQLGRAAAPEWVPDEQCTTCLACSMPFTLIRRRHHCRNCGKIYCGRCSSNFVPLPHYGHHKPVRVCNRCFMFQVTAFTMNNHS